ALRSWRRRPFFSKSTVYIVTYSGLRQRARERGPYAKAASLFRDVVEAVFDLRAVEDVLDVAEADLQEVGARLEGLSRLAAELCR
ncbi:MAG: hypothetical protein ABWK05_09065, partial [Pyrobaculum sp.]